MILINKIEGDKICIKIQQNHVKKIQLTYSKDSHKIKSI